VLRFHPALYYQKDAAGKSHKVAEYPAMLACIQGEDGHAVTLHRTYLQDGAKLAVPTRRRCCLPVSTGPRFVFEATADLGISEGIEKSIAASRDGRLFRAQRRQPGEAVAPDGSPGLHLCRQRC
jgi:putative DNA primase/helicase